MAGGKLWTDAQIATLRQMIVDGASGDEIAEALSVTRAAVGSKMQRLGLRFFPAHVEGRYRQALAHRIVPRKRRGVIPSAETRAKRSATFKARLADPAELERLRASAVKNFAGNDPAVIGPKISAAKMAWCPEYLRPVVRDLMYRKGMRLAEIRPAISDTLCRDLRRALKSIAAAVKPYAEEQRRQYRSFEAELERARVNGIRDVVPMQRADYHLSLTGGSLA